uniref:Bm268 n=1 Tax=Brugia malayi TaxID=6279 RepID=A0A0J9XNG6_BRUMA|nr:Bm268 [Brugia malayi]
MVFDDLHQLIPSYHEYSITDLLTHSYSPTSGDSAGMPEYFISRGHQ